MENIYILREIAKFDGKLWKLFSLLNWDCYKYFNISDKEYELKFRKITIDKFETCYRLDGKKHRTDGPAVIKDNVTEYWYFKGKLHRLDGPAIFTKGYCGMWYVDDKLHRLNGPAIEFYSNFPNRFNEWYVNGKFRGTSSIGKKYDKYIAYLHIS